MTDTIRPPTAPASPFAPFRHRLFFWLWLGVVCSSIGGWAQTVGAQWLFINDPNATTIVPLVQTANTLPMMLLALPAGVLADAFDRRWMMLAVQVYSVTIAVLLAVLTALDKMPPALLLAFVFAVGAGMAMNAPTWQSLITELVPRDEIAAATRLDMVSVNVSRAAGPAIAGFIIATWGVPPVFAMNAALTLLLVLVLLVWRRPSVVTGSDRERFLPALRAGGRYVRHTPAIRTLLLRFVTFVVPAGAVWALLPLIASRQLSTGASGYGILFASLGVGAVGGALGLGVIKRHLSSNTVLALAAALFGAAFACLAFTTSVPVAVPLLIACGFGWSSTVATVTAEMQLLLPGWVRARGLGILLMVFLGTQAIFAPIWGIVVGQVGIRTTLLCAAGLLAVSVATVRLLRVPDAQNLDRAPLTYWDTPGSATTPTRPAPSWCRSSTPSTPPPATTSSPPCRHCAAPGSGLAPSAGTCTGSGKTPSSTSSNSRSPAGTNTNANTTAGSPVRTKPSKTSAFAYVVGSPRPHHLLPADDATSNHPIDR